MEMLLVLLLLPHHLKHTLTHAPLSQVSSQIKVPYFLQRSIDRPAVCCPTYNSFLKTEYLSISGPMMQFCRPLVKYTHTHTSCHRIEPNRTKAIIFDLIFRLVPSFKFMRNRNQDPGGRMSWSFDVKLLIRNHV